MPTEVRKPDVPMDELGVTGLQYTGRRGLVMEEFLPELGGERGMRVYREMRENDPVISAVFYAIEMLIRQVDWRVEGPDEEAAEFVRSCMYDMSHTWKDFLCEVLSMLAYGYSWHEIVYKRRMGESRDPARSSQHSDGRIGWRKMPIRAQDTRQEWEFDETDGGVTAFVQMAPPKYELLTIPLSRSLLFRTGLHKGNPEGRSLLRGCYRPWFMKRRIENIESVGIERDLAGVPMIWRSPEIAEAYDPAFKTILKNIRRDEQEGLLLPLAYDENGKELVRFELLRAAGSRQIDVSQVIDRYDKRIAMTCMSDFLLLGQEAVGSFALADSKTSLFATALGAVLDSIAATINRHAIPRLLGVNGWRVEKMPEVKPGDIESPDFKELGAWITALAGAGATLFPDEDLENHLRSISNLPLKKEESTAQPRPPKPRGAATVPPEETLPEED